MLHTKMSQVKLELYHYVILVLILVHVSETQEMSKDEKRKLRDEAKAMFYHGYRNYMEHAFPADELMPLSCKGRHRGTKPSRGDVDDVLGNFSLTLVDSFDTLVVLGDVTEFELAARHVINSVTFDRDIVVSVFETNIRILGGLLSGHVLATHVQSTRRGMSWYRGELLDMAKDVGERLLPAFNTTTGIPFPRINLLYGVKPSMARTGHEKDTCTACAGTMLLEFAALSRLTGEPIFEAKAHRAMDSLWRYRHRSSNLVGTVINIHSGEWVRRDSGIGAGVDSYYEYLLKAYILLGDDIYLDRFNKHYDSIMRYINQGPLMVDVHMHKPHANSRNFMDALFAFWPGLQVLKGDMKSAIEIHEMLYQVMQRHNFLPEAFTTDFRVHWAQHPLRPEFIESTYFLYRATKDPHYLDVGKKVLENLKRHAQVDCGFASIKHVTTGQKEDQMDSFVLSETFKYLFLLFSEEEDLILNIDDYVFTTEAHLLPLSLSLHEASERNISTDGAGTIFYQQEVDDDSHEVTCPNFANYDVNYGQRLRHPLKNMVESACPKAASKSGSSSRKQRLKATEFMAGNTVQLNQLKDMGIKIVTMSDGRVQLYHTASDALTQDDAENGMVFMQEMIELSKSQAADPTSDPHVVQLLSDPYYGNTVYQAGPAQFGYDLQANPGVKGQLVLADPLPGCGGVLNAGLVAGRVAVVRRGECMFIDKARVLEEAGAIAGIVIDNVETSSAENAPLFAMSGDSVDDVSIPMVFLFAKEGRKLLAALEKHPDLRVHIAHKAKTFDEVLKDMLRAESIPPPQPLSERMLVRIRRFDGNQQHEGGDPVLHLFRTKEGQDMFRIVQRLSDEKLEIQFEKQALELATKNKLSALIEKVASMVQTDINFGDMDLIQQSDHLFSLGKLMEISVNEESEEILAHMTQDILENELHLNYDDVMRSIGDDKTTQSSVGVQHKLYLLLSEVLENYIEEQLNAVYYKATEFLGKLGLKLQPDPACGHDPKETPQPNQQGILTEECGANNYATEQELVNPEPKMNKFRIFKIGNVQLKDSRTMYKPAPWMILADDEIYLDEDGQAYANDASEYYSDHSDTAHSIEDITQEINQALDMDTDMYGDLTELAVSESGGDVFEEADDDGGEDLLGELEDEAEEILVELQYLLDDLCDIQPLSSHSQESIQASIEAPQHLETKDSIESINDPESLETLQKQQTQESMNVDSNKNQPAGDDTLIRNENNNNNINKNNMHLTDSSENVEIASDSLESLPVDSSDFAQHEDIIRTESASNKNDIKPENVASKKGRDEL